MKPVVFSLSFAALAWTLQAAAVAEPEGVSPAAPPTAPKDGDINIRGVFTSDLPDVGRKHSLKLLWHPHLADLVKYDIFRTDLGLKYTMSTRFELRATSAGYFSHGLGATSFLQDAGFGAIELATKYRLPKTPWPAWDCAVSLRFSTPINSPPVDVTDGLEHRIAYASFARSLPRYPHLRIFCGLGVDFVRETSVAGRHEDNDLRDDNHYLSAGFLINRGRTHYTLESKWTSTRLLGSTSEDVFELRPGIVWELGRPRDDGRRSRWLLGTSLSTTFGPDGTEFGLGARVRVDFDLKRLFRRNR